MHVKENTYLLYFVLTFSPLLHIHHLERKKSEEYVTEIEDPRNRWRPIVKWIELRSSDDHKDLDGWVGQEPCCLSCLKAPHRCLFTRAYSSQKILINFINSCIVEVCKYWMHWFRVWCIGINFIYLLIYYFFSQQSILLLSHKWQLTLVEFVFAVFA